MKSWFAAVAKDEPGSGDFLERVKFFWREDEEHEGRTPPRHCVCPKCDAERSGFGVHAIDGAPRIATTRTGYGGGRARRVWKLSVSEHNLFDDVLLPPLRRVQHDLFLEHGARWSLGKVRGVSGSVVGEDEVAGFGAEPPQHHNCRSSVSAFDVIAVVDYSNGHDCSESSKPMTLEELRDRFRK